METHLQKKTEREARIKSAVTEEIIKEIRTIRTGEITA